jgi:hypothetical protein
VKLVFENALNPPEVKEEKMKLKQSPETIMFWVRPSENERRQIAKLFPEMRGRPPL